MKTTTYYLLPLAELLLRPTPSAPRDFETQFRAPNRLLDERGLRHVNPALLFLRHQILRAFARGFGALLVNFVRAFGCVGENDNFIGARL